MSITFWIQKQNGKGYFSNGVIYSRIHIFIEVKEKGLLFFLTQVTVSECRICAYSSSIKKADYSNNKMQNIQKVRKGDSWMKIKDFALSMLLNGFLGYLWVLFITQIIQIANSLNNTFFVGGLIIIIGSGLFWEIVKRVAPYNEYKFTHPVKITGFISFTIVVVTHLFVVNLI